MIKVTIETGDTPSFKLITFNFFGGTILFTSHRQARQWQYHKIFGKSPDFSHLDGVDEAYILDLFDLKNDFSTRLVTGEPCRIQHLKRITEAMNINVSVENYLVEPSFNN